MNNKKSLYSEILLMSVIPILILGITITIICVYRFSITINSQVKKELKDIALVVLNTYDRIYPGNYTITRQNDELEIYKGEKNISKEYDYIDSIKKDTGIDITISYYNNEILTRILTTIFEDNKRLVGTIVDLQIQQDVLLEEQEIFYNSVYISKKQFFAYYKPIFDFEGNPIGVIFAGKPTDQVNHEIYSNIFPAIIIILISTCFVALFFFCYVHTIIKILIKLKKFMSDISHGELYSELDDLILKRTDEIGVIGQSAVEMQKALKIFVDQDVLTQINNRRCGQKLLKKSLTDFKENNIPFSLAIGDIDWFKSVNDNFGHECGDFVLQRIASILKKNIEGKGYVARWGGEEFLIVFENSTLDKAYELLDKIANEIRNTVIVYENQEIHITMTFGLVECTPSEDMCNTIEEFNIVKEADKKLYLGKNQGRNKIVQ